MAAMHERASLPGPRPLPIVGSLLEFREHGLLPIYLGHWRRYGDVIGYRFGPQRAVAIVHPDHLREVFIRRRASYGKGLSVRNVRPLIGDGLFAADGDLWQRQRRILQPLFTVAAVRAYGAAMGEAIDAFIARWLALPPGEAVDLLPEMSHLAMDVICRTMFGMAAGAEAGELSAAVSEAFHWVGERGVKLLPLPLRVPTPGNRAFLRAKARIDRFIRRVIAERRRRGPRADGGDLLDRLLQATDEESGERMLEEQVVNEVITVFIAGHETTAVTLTWAWLLLAGHREVEARLHAELDAVLSGQPPTIEAVPKLVYTRQVIDEALRLYPPVWLDPREAFADEEIAGYPIPKGTLIMPMLYATHRHPEFWPDPERFDPERFSPERAQGRHPLAHVPFGGGPRVCLGMAFALQEMVLAVAALGQRFRVRRAYGTLMDLDPKAGTLRPRWPSLVEVERRE